MNPKRSSEKFKKQKIETLYKVTQKDERKLDKFLLDLESEREQAVFCKRGQKKLELLKGSDYSTSTEKNKQSLIDAKEPSSDIISRASYLRSHGLSSDKKKAFEYSNTNCGGPEILNFNTNDYFGK